MKTQIATVDFETRGILPHPDFPPEPVGFGVRLPGGKSKYWAWGHDGGGNNCTKREAVRVIKQIWSRYHLLCHNAQFDIEVAEQRLGIPAPAWDRVHDTMLLAFLHDPNSRELDLKLLSTRHLGLKHPGLDNLREWIITHIPEARRRKSEWGAHIWRAPAALAGRYCKADLRDTWALWRFYAPVLASMRAAYEREQALAPRLTQMSARGIPVNVAKLQQERATGAHSVARLERWMRRRLKAPGLDTWAGDQLADAIEDADLVCEEGWIATPGGSRSTSKDNLSLVVTDDFLCGALEARALIAKQLNTHVEPWLAQAEHTGKIYCGWNQVRSAEGSKSFGARTGRLSSSPNVQNVSARERQFRLPRSMRDIAQLDLRGCVAAPRGWRVYAEDYSQQELRLLAHFAGGPLLAAYQANLRLDMHVFARDLINDALGSDFSRTQIKVTGFGIIYGMGLAKLSRDINTDRSNAQVLRSAYRQQLGLQNLERQLKSQDFVETWGGRICPTEPPRETENGEWRDFRYKNINTLIQGSGADMTKQAMIDFSEQVPESLAISVHDELVGFAQTRDVRRVKRQLSECMRQQPGFSLAFPTDGAFGKTWKDCK